MGQYRLTNKRGLPILIVAKRNSRQVGGGAQEKFEQASAKLGEMTDQAKAKLEEVKSSAKESKKE